MENRMINIAAAFAAEQFKLIYQHDLACLANWVKTGRWAVTPTPTVTKQLPVTEAATTDHAPVQTADQAKAKALVYQKVILSQWQQKVTKPLGALGFMAIYRNALVGPRLINIGIKLTNPNRQALELAQRELKVPLQAAFHTNDISIEWIRGNIVISFPHPDPWSPGAEQTLANTPRAMALQERIDERKREDLTTFMGLDAIGTPVALQLHEAPMLGFIGSTGYGKSTCIKAALFGLCRRNGPRRVQFAVLAQKTGGWGLLKRWPHCIGVYGPNDTDETAKLVRRLRKSVATRAEKVENGWDLNPSTILILDDAPDVLAANPNIIDDLDIIFRSGREPRIYSWLSAQGAGEKAMTGSTSIDNNISVRVGFFAPNAGAAYRNFGRSGVDMTKLTRAGDAYINVNGTQRIVTPYIPDSELATLCNDGGNAGLGIEGIPYDVTNRDDTRYLSGSSDVKSDVHHSDVNDVSTSDAHSGLHRVLTSGFEAEYLDYLPDARVNDIEALTELECVACLWAVERKERSKRKLMQAMFGNVGTPQSNKLKTILARGQAVIDSLQPTSEDIPEVEEEHDVDVLDQIGDLLEDDNDE